MAQAEFGKFVKNRFASLVSFLNAGTDLVASNVQAALVELAARHFGKRFGYSESLGDTINVLPTPISKLTQSFIGLESGTYRIAYTFEIESDKNNTNAQADVVAGGTIVYTDTQIGAGKMFRSGFVGDVALSGDVDITLDLTQATGNGISTMRQAKLELWRLT